MFRLEVGIKLLKLNQQQRGLDKRIQAETAKLLNDLTVRYNEAVK